VDGGDKLRGRAVTRPSGPQKPAGIIKVSVAAAALDVAALDILLDPECWYVSLYFAAPPQQPVIRCYERSIVGNGRRGDKPVGGVAMQIFKVNREQRHVACQREFKNASIKQFCS
jgi:hypothetical protein